MEATQQKSQSHITQKEHKRLPYFCRIIGYLAILFIVMYGFFMMIKPCLQYAVYIEKSKLEGIQKNKQQLLKILDQAIRVPFFGYYFYEQYVLELAMDNKWEQLVVVAQQAVQKGHSAFSLYYHLSLGYCMEEKFYECKAKTIETLEKAQNEYERGFIKDIVNILFSNNVIGYNEEPFAKLLFDNKQKRTRYQSRSRRETIQQL